MTKTRWLDGAEIPLVETCDRCCACCMEQGSPPGYLMFATGQVCPEGDDGERWLKTPKKYRELVFRYLDRLSDDDDPTNGEGPCCWLDEETQQCFAHRWRPNICRDFQVGCDECYGWRDDYGVR